MHAKANDKEYTAYALYPQAIDVTRRTLSVFFRDIIPQDVAHTVVEFCAVSEPAHEFERDAGDEPSDDGRNGDMRHRVDEF